MENQSVSFDYCVEKYLFWCENLRNQAPSTVIDKRDRLRQFKQVTNIKLMSEFTNALMDQYIIEMRKRTYRGNHIKARTINKRLGLIIYFIKWCRNMMNVDIPIKIEMIFYLQAEVTTRRTYYTRTDIVEALQFANDRSKVAIMIAFDSGARLSEIRNIRIQDIKDRTIEIVGKGRKQGILHISEQTQDLINDYVAKNDIQEYIFASNRKVAHGLPITTANLRNLIKKPFLKAGFDDFYPHALRHSAATDMQLSGASTEDIQTFLRHSDTKVTQRYLHMFDVYSLERYDKYKKPLQLIPQ